MTKYRTLEPPHPNFHSLTIFPHAQLHIFRNSHPFTVKAPQKPHQPLNTLFHAAVNQQTHLMIRWYISSKGRISWQRFYHINTNKVSYLLLAYQNFKAIQSIIMFLYVPLKRELNQDWAQVNLPYLEQHLEGKPKELIKGCRHMEPSSGYIESKRLLEEKYGDPYKVSNVYLTRVIGRFLSLTTNWPILKSDD